MDNTFSINHFHKWLVDRGSPLVKVTANDSWHYHIEDAVMYNDYTVLLYAVNLSFVMALHNYFLEQEMYERCAHSLSQIDQFKKSFVKAHTCL